MATCPSCGGPLADTSDRCHRCGQATTHRYFTGTSGNPVRKTPNPPPDIALPHTVTEARFTFGETWTHGILYLTDLGIYFLSESDGPWTPERLTEILAHDPSKPRDVGKLSHFLPLNRIVRFQHSRLTSFAIVTPEGKRPLRLASDGWRVMDSYAAKTAIPTS